MNSNNTPVYLLQASTSLPFSVDEDYDFVSHLGSLYLDYAAHPKELEDKIYAWEFEYYKDLNRHINIRDTHVPALNSIFGVNGDLRYYTNSWPRPVSREQYDQLKSYFKIAFLRQRPCTEEFAGKFFFCPNLKFWEQFENRNMIFYLLNASEINFTDPMLLMDSLSKIVDGSIVYLEHLMGNRQYENLYYLGIALKEYQVALVGKGIIQPNSPDPKRILSIENRFHSHGYYMDSNEFLERILEDKRDEIASIKEIIRHMQDPPFTYFRVSSHSPMVIEGPFEF